MQQWTVLVLTLAIRVALLEASGYFLRVAGTEWRSSPRRGRSLEKILLEFTSHNHNDSHEDPTESRLWPLGLGMGEDNRPDRSR